MKNNPIFSLDFPNPVHLFSDGVQLFQPADRAPSPKSLPPQAPAPQKDRIFLDPKAKDPTFHGQMLISQAEAEANRGDFDSRAQANHFPAPQTHRPVFSHNPNREIGLFEEVQRGPRDF